MDHEIVRYQIGRFMQITQLSRKALRLYEQHGFLEPAYVDPDSGYRFYDDTQVERARLIRLLREMDMPLAGVQRVLVADVATATRLIDTYQQEVANRTAAIVQTAAVVKQRLRKEQTMSFTIAEKDIPEMQVLTHLSRVNITTFQDHIKKTLHMLANHIQENGTIAGDPMCFYHGRVDEESDGPVEIVWPYKGQVPATDVMGTRTLPAHKVAFHKADMAHSRYPEALQVWEAVIDYARQRGYDTKMPKGLDCYEIWPEDMTIVVGWPFEA